MDSLIREGYRGGKVDIYSFPVEYTHKNGLYYQTLDGDFIQEIDENSMYPAQFRHNYPIGDYDILIHRKNIPDKEGFFVGSLHEKKSHLPVLPTVYTDKMIFGYGDKIGVWSIPMIRYADSLGLITIKKGWWLVSNSKGKPFEKFARVMYDKRLTYKDDKNLGLMYIYKIILVSLYGKLGQKFVAQSFELVKGKIDFFDDKYIDKIVLDMGKYTVISHEAQIIKEFMMVDKAFYTTANGQIDLHKKTMEIGKPIYSDTDSLHYYGKRQKDSNKLGEWKNEYPEIIQAIYINPKMYWIMFKDDDDVIRTSCKAKGFPRSVFNYSNSGKERLIPLEEYLYIIKNGFNKDIYLSLKQALRQRYKILAHHNFNRKVIMGDSKKRIYLSDGNTEPIEVQLPEGEFEKLELLISQIREKQEKNKK